MENFLTYPRADANARFTITGSRVTFTGLLDTDDAHYIYSDKGAAYYSGDFAFNFTLKITSSEKNVTQVMVCGLANAVGDFDGLDTAAESGLFVYIRHPNSPDQLQINVWELDSGTIYAGNGGTYYNLTANTVYYCTLYRDENTGTYGTLYLKIYSDSARSTLLTTLSLALHTSKKDFRYLYAVDSYDGATTKAVSGYIELLEELANGILPVVTQGAPTSITATTATGNGFIESIGLSAVTEHGHCWATTANPTTSDSKTTNGAGAVGSFTSAITGLTPGTRYYVRAYATNSFGTSYSAGLSFVAGGISTLNDPGEIWLSIDTAAEFHHIGIDGVDYTHTGV